VTSEQPSHRAMAPADATRPWSEWLQPPDGDIDRWLEHLDAQLAQRGAAFADDEAQASALWRHMSTGLHRFRPEEVSNVVSTQLEAARNRSAVEALQAMVRLEREHLSQNAASKNDHASAASSDSRTVRRLLDGIATDRTVTGRALTSEVLETLCSIALDLELTERRVGHDPASIGEALTVLRGHITTAAHMVRALPDNVAVRAETGEALSMAVRRCLLRFSGSLEAELTWSGADTASAETASALLWVVQEVLHHLHHAVAGWTKVTVRVDSRGVATRIETPSMALAVAGGEPDWLLRARLRLELAGGSISTGTSSGSSYVDVRLP
jgi:hypothetical protein